MVSLEQGLTHSDFCHIWGLSVIKTISDPLESANFQNYSLCDLSPQSAFIASIFIWREEDWIQRHSKKFHSDTSRPSLPTTSFLSHPSISVCHKFSMQVWGFTYLEILCLFFLATHSVTTWNSVGLCGATLLHTISSGLCSYETFQFPGLMLNIWGIYYYYFFAFESDFLRLWGQFFFFPIRHR